MKIVIIGGSGLIGSKLAAKLTAAGHEVVAASPSSGVNAVSGEGLAEVLQHTQVVVDVSNSPSFADGPVMEFFEKSSRNLMAVEAAAGVVHHVALSVVGAERLPDAGYMRAKLAQEAIITAGKVPYTIVRATQFFEFLGAIAQGGTDAEGVVRVSSSVMQPIAAEDVAAALADVAVGKPVNGMVEIAGPEKLPMSEFVSRALAAKGDTRKVVGDPATSYFGAVIDDRSLTPDGGARIGGVNLVAWLSS